MIKRLGLIAGGGDFPLLFARTAKDKGISLICIAIKDEASPELEKLVDKTYWISFGEVKKAIDILKKEKIKKAVMLGKITKTRIFKEEDRSTIDDRGNLILKLAKDKRDLTIFKTGAKLLRLYGIKIVSCLICLRENLAQKGCLTKRPPSSREWEDIRFGYKIAKRLSGLDIGQAVVVKDKVVLSVEAIEGTDSAIKRASILGNGEVVVVKVARPNQDMRFDVPVIGIHTINSLKEGKASCLALEKNKTLIINKEELTKAADEAGISVVVI
ncbi:MAG: UDP-2,3-diacylglucosamine diphosphatase LpxI [Candidatus Omnitrophica bacterium]|nr:UDP-2,3-diacylglucosamine diphosphatase LpxI [Candidatus Omnitrophota bacterium]